MINSAPTQGGKYKQGLYTPKNKDKLIKANSYGGVYYRSGLEQKMMIYLDLNDNIRVWGAEYLKVPYKKSEYNNSTHDLETTEHTYFPDFYYELIRYDGSISKVVAEVKPSSEVKIPELPQNATAKQLKNFEYSLKMYNKNISKWTYMIEYCERKGFEFVIITEQHLARR
jgi:hypothetical protein